MSQQPSFNIPGNFAVNNETREETDNDRAITVESIKKMLHDLFEKAGFQKVGLAVDPVSWQIGKTNMWGYGYMNMVVVDPYIQMDKPLRKLLNYGPGPYGDGWPAQWRIVQNYLGGNNGGELYYQGNKNIPDFLIGVYYKHNWEEDYNTRLDKALMNAMFEGDQL